MAEGGDVGGGFDFDDVDYLGGMDNSVDSILGEGGCHIGDVVWVVVGDFYSGSDVDVVLDRSKVLVAGVKPSFPEGSVLGRKVRIFA